MPCWFILGWAKELHGLRCVIVAIQPVSPRHGHGGCKEGGGNDSATHIQEIKLKCWEVPLDGDPHGPMGSPHGPGLGRGAVTI